jgi:hypothetical protein
MMHASHAGASTWISATVGETFTFSEIYIKGNAHLAFDYGASQSQASIVAGNIVGDKTGSDSFQYLQYLAPLTKMAAMI